MKENDSLSGALIHSVTRFYRHKTIRQMLAFSAVGLANTAVGLSVIFLLMVELGLNPWVANLGGYIVGLSVSFVLNRWWTFRRDAAGVPLISYILAFAVAYAANIAVLSALIAMWPEHRLASQAAALATYTVIFFTLCRMFVFSGPVRRRNR